MWCWRFDDRAPRRAAAAAGFGGLMYRNISGCVCPLALGFGGVRSGPGASVEGSLLLFEQNRKTGGTTRKPLRGTKSSPAFRRGPLAAPPTKTDPSRAFHVKHIRPPHPSLASTNKPKARERPTAVVVTGGGGVIFRSNVCVFTYAAVAAIPLAVRLSARGRCGSGVCAFVDRVSGRGRSFRPLD